MQYANQIKAAHIVVIGENELATGQVELKEMSTGNKRVIPLEQLVDTIKEERHACRHHKRHQPTIQH
jgi:histidyl-tRNA synthetase